MYSLMATARWGNGQTPCRPCQSRPPQKPQDFKLSQPGAGRQRINVADAGGRVWLERSIMVKGEQDRV